MSSNLIIFGLCFVIFWGAVILGGMLVQTRRELVKARDAAAIAIAAGKASQKQVKELLEANREQQTVVKIWRQMARDRSFL